MLELLIEAFDFKKATIAAQYNDLHIFQCVMLEYEEVVGEVPENLPLFWESANTSHLEALRLRDLRNPRYMRIRRDNVKLANLQVNRSLALLWKTMQQREDILRWQKDEEAIQVAIERRNALFPGGLRRHVNMTFPAKCVEHPMFMERVKQSDNYAYLQHLHLDEMLPELEVQITKFQELVRLRNQKLVALSVVQEAETLAISDYMHFAGQIMGLATGGHALGRHLLVELLAQNAARKRQAKAKRAQKKLLPTT